MDEFMRRVMDGEYVMEENRKIDKKARQLNRKFTDKFSDDKKVAAAGAVVGALSANLSMGLGVPSLVIGGLVGAATAKVASKAMLNIQKKKVMKYTKGEPITRNTVSKLLNACQTRKDLVKFEVWLEAVDIALKNMFENQPEFSEKADDFRKWLDKEIYSKKLPAKRKEIETKYKKVKESYEFKYMSTEKKYELLEEEASLYNETNSTSVTNPINIYNMFDEKLTLYENINRDEDLEIVNEFSLGKFMEKRADKKAFKQQMKDTIVINKNELSKYEKEIKDVVKSVQNVIKREVPGCKFDDTKLSHHTYEKNGYEFNLYIMDIFTLNKDNFLKFASKSKNKTIMNAKTVNDCSKEIKKEVKDRLMKPIQSISGLSKDPDEPWCAVKNKDGKTYISVSATEEVLSTSIGLEAKVAIKLDE